MSFLASSASSATTGPMTPPRPKGRRRETCDVSVARITANRPISFTWKSACCDHRRRLAYPGQLFPWRSPDWHPIRHRSGLNGRTNALTLQNISNWRKTHLFIKRQAFLGCDQSAWHSASTIKTRFHQSAAEATSAHGFSNDDHIYRGAASEVVVSELPTTFSFSSTTTPVLIASAVSQSSSLCANRPVAKAPARLRDVRYQTERCRVGSYALPGSLLLHRKNNVA